MPTLRMEEKYTLTHFYFGFLKLEVSGLIVGGSVSLDVFDEWIVGKSVLKFSKL